MARIVNITCHDERGMTTAGMVVALLLTLSMIFSSAQVYRIQSVASKVQSVADASALAAQNVVGEFMIAVRLCDAVVLSLSLTGLAATGIGTVAICVPGGQAAGTKLLEAGKKVIDARDSFSKRAVEGLNKVQRSLPFLSTVAAASVASANGKGSAQYAAIAISVPTQTQNINEPSDGAAARDAIDDAGGKADEIKKLAQQAEQAANDANSAKLRGFQSDCGGEMGYCMYERARTLALMSGSDNPKYSSVDTWNFSVALKRARAYYPQRLALEQPKGTSVAAQAQSHLRKKFYEFAQREVARGYVHESDSSFDAYFPRLPKNTTEMKQTTLYTNVAYPCTKNEDGKLVMHAWDGCPGAKDGIVGYDSIKTMDTNAWPKCSECDFAASSMGRVASASTAIDNGFEYHYNAVADAAEDYKKALERAKPASDGVKSTASGVLEKIIDAIKNVCNVRIKATPPGHFGTIVLVASVGSESSQGAFQSLFVKATGQIGQRAAVSAATLVEDTSGEGKNVITSLTSNIASKGGILTGGASMLLNLWSGALNVYTQGHEALSGGIRSFLDSLPLVGASGLGKWAQSKFNGLVAGLGFEPPNLNALRPVVVNSAHVAQAGSADSVLCARLTEIKRVVVENPLMSNDTFVSVAQTIERSIFQGIDSTEKIEIASIDLGGLNTGASLPIYITLPPAVKEYAKEKVDGLFDSLLSVYANISGAKPWE